MTGVVVPRGGLYLNTESGLSAPGGLLDRLTQSLDNRAQYQGTLRGLAPALQGNGIPVQAPASGGILSQMLGAVGLGSQQQPPAMPLARVGGEPGDRGGGAPPNADGTAGPPPQAMAFAPAGSDANSIIPTIAQAAQKYGIDPMTALRVARSEGGFAPATAGDANSSFGPFQLHYASGPVGSGNSSPGLGDDFTKATGLDARDPKNAAAAIDFALAHASKNGWGAFHGAAKAGIGQFDGIGGSPSQATAYAPSGASGDVARAPAAQALGGAAPMPIATGSPTMRQTPQPGSQPTDADTVSSTATPGQVLGPLMANASTRPIVAQMMQQPAGGGMPSSINLPAGMTPDALAAMISEPATMQMGLGIWQKSLFPQVTSVEPGRAIFAGTRYVGQSPSAPMAVKAGESVINPNSGSTIAAVPPDLQHAEIGRDAYGQPQYGAFNPRGGNVAPFQVPAAGGTATGPDGQPLSGDAFLGTLPPAVAGQVRAIADGRVKMPSGMGSTSPIAQRLRAAVLQYDPSFDQTGVDARFETRKDFASGDAAKTITAGNTALIHLGELASLADKLGNADTSIPGNNLYNYAKNSANASSAAGAPLAAFNATASKYVEEATKFYRGTGGTEGDINRDMLNISPNMSPTQLKAAIAAQLPLIQGKVDALQGRWKQGMGPKASDYPLLSPQAQAALSRLAPQAQAAAGPAAASLPVAAPAGSGGSPANASPLTGALDQARAAIVRGAPRAAVLQRLQQMGIDASGSGI